MAREEDLTDQQLVQDKTILEITYENGFPEFSDVIYSGIAADDEYPDDSDSDNDSNNESHTAVDEDDAYPDDGIGAVPACEFAIFELLETVAGEATREEVCAVCMEAFMEGQQLRIACPSLHRFHESCIFQWLTINRVCPVCRHAVQPAEQETDEDRHTDTAAEDTVTGSDAETDEDESGETDKEVSDIASETDSSTDRETDDAYTTEETDTGSEAETEATETDTVSGGETEGDTTEETDTESDEEAESDSWSDW